MELKNIFDRIETIYFILNPKLELGCFDIENQNGFSSEQSTFKAIDSLLTNFEDWLSQCFSQQYYKTQQYQKLEVYLQKQEADIRNHIKVQQQLKIYCQSITMQLETLQKQYDYLDKEAEATITNLRSQNQRYIEDIRKLQNSILGTQKIYNNTSNQAKFENKIYVEDIENKGSSQLKPVQYKYIYYTPLQKK